MPKRYSLIANIRKDFPFSAILVGRRFGKDYYRIVSQQRILRIKPLAYYHPICEKYSIGLAVPMDELQGIADRYYQHNNIYINNTLKIWT